MSTLTDLRAALEAYDAAKKAAASLPDYMVTGECVEAYQQLVRVLFENRAALLDVAEAAIALSEVWGNPKYLPGTAKLVLDTQVRPAFAPLVKEADHDRA